MVNAQRMLQQQAGVEPWLCDAGLRQYRLAPGQQVRYRGQFSSICASRPAW